MDLYDLLAAIETDMLCPNGPRLRPTFAQEPGLYYRYKDYLEDMIRERKIDHTDAERAWNFVK